MTPWTCQTPLSVEFSRQEYWSGLPFPSPGDLLDPHTEPGSPVLQADLLLSKPPGKEQTNLQSQQLSKKSLFPERMEMTVVFIFDNLKVMRSYIAVSFICISLTITTVEHIDVYWLSVSF